MRVALATCSDLPTWEVDDAPLHAAFVDRGVEIVRPAWDDPGFDWSRCDACLIRTTWDYQQRRSEFLAWAERAAAATRLFNPLEVVKWNTHKRYLHDLEERGVPTIPTMWLEPGSAVDLDRVLTQRGWRRAFLKPAIGSTARETLRFDATPAGLAAANAHLTRMLATESMLLQPYLERVETEGELSAVFIDGRFSHAVRKIPTPGDYRVQDDFEATDEPATLSSEELRLAREILGTVDGDLLYGRVDLLRDDDGLLRLSELELVEPSLFFRHGPRAAERLAESLCRRVFA